jgi:fructose/tagatose bisphosphate aldolase
LNGAVSRAIVVHSLDHALAALAAAKKLNIPVTLISAAGAAFQAGPAWFKALITEATATHPDISVTAILDCGDEAGTAMAALRAGLTHLRFDGPDTVRDKLGAIGAVLVETPVRSLDLLDIREPQAACEAFLNGS